MKTTYTDANTVTFVETAVSLNGKENLLLELDNVGKVQLATAGKAMGVMRGKLTPGAPDITVRPLGKNGTVRVVQKAAITPGDQVVQDPANPTKVITFAQATSMRVLGRKIYPATAGADGDIIEILDVPETALTKTTLTAATNAGAAAITALAVGAAYSQAEVTALRAQISALAADLAALKANLVSVGIVA